MTPRPSPVRSTARPGRPRQVCRLLGLALVLGLAACGGGGGGGGSTSPGGPANVAPTFTLQPLGTTVNLGATATFTAAAAGTPAPTFQWERSTDGAAWTALGGATSATFSLTAAKTDHAAFFRAKAVNAAGSATSGPAVLAVQWAPSFTLQPVDPSVQAPATATFSVAADANPPASLQWQSSPDGFTWTDVAGATTAVYTLVTTTPAMDGLRHRCLAVNVAGSATSQIATLRVNVPSFTLTVQVGNGATGTPAASRSVAVGTPVDYAYAVQPGFTNLSVQLDGATAPASGTVLMNGAHALTVSASPIQRTVTFAAGAGGTLSGQVSQTVANGGGTTPVTAIPNGGFNFVNWTGAGFAGSTANPLTLAGVTQDLALTANFSATPTFPLTVSVGAGVTGSPLTGSVQTQGTVVPYAYQLQAGFSNLSVKVDGGSVGATGTVTMNAAHSLTATAQAVPSNTIQVGQGGLLFAPNDLSVKVGTAVTFHWASSGHSVVIGNPCTPGGVLNTGVQSAGFEVVFTPSATGDVPFFCQPHCGFGMTGVIHVTP